METENFIVNYIGIGDDKAATSWIFACLKEHPEVCGSDPKETNYFTKNFNKGLSWYKKCFAHCQRDKLIGEYSPDYFRYEKAAERIYNHFPKTKLILCLREPIDSFLSAYYHQYSRGKSIGTVDEYFKNINYSDLLKYKYIQNYLKYFSPNQLLVLIYDDIEKDPIAFIKKIYKFLGVDSAFIPKYVTDRINVTVKNKTRILFLNRFLWSVRKFIKDRKHSEYYIRILKKIGINFIAVKIFRLNQRRKNLKRFEKILPSREYIKKIKLFCKQDLEELERFINRDLSNWYKQYD